MFDLLSSPLAEETIDELYAAGNDQSAVVEVLAKLLDRLDRPGFAEYARRLRDARFDGDRIQGIIDEMHAAQVGA